MDGHKCHKHVPTTLPLPNNIGEDLSLGVIMDSKKKKVSTLPAIFIQHLKETRACTGQSGEETMFIFTTRGKVTKNGGLDRIHPN